jgi:hypothetical protein
MGLVLNQHGTPEPPSDVLARLRRVHPALSLRWSQMPNRPWSMTWEWPETDARWGRVRSNEISPDAAYDIIGYLPTDCPIDQAGAYVENALKQYPRDEVRKVRERMHKWNEVDKPKEQMNEVLTDTMDNIGAERRQKNPRRQRVTITPAS